MSGRGQDWGKGGVLLNDVIFSAVVILLLQKLELGLDKGLSAAQGVRRKIQEKIEEGKKIFEGECIPTQKSCETEKTHHLPGVGGGLDIVTCP